MENESIKQMWGNYLLSIGESPDATDKNYTAWHFDNNERDANQLAELVLEGTKRATASLYDSYRNGEEIPKIGDLSIITNWNDIAKCIIMATSIEVVPYKDVDEEFAATEGEGDKSLEYWRRVHRKFFTEELAEIGGEFSEEILVVCEKFEVVFK